MNAHPGEVFKTLDRALNFKSYKNDSSTKFCPQHEIFDNVWAN